jgi:hypothetical protein
MKTVKLVLKIMLAITLPLQAMALGSSGADQEMDIEAKLKLEALKVDQDRLQKELSNSTLTLQALKDIADPSLMGYYRQLDIELMYATAAIMGAASGFGPALALADVSKYGKKGKIGAVALYGAAAAAGAWTANKMFERDSEGWYSDLVKNLRVKSPQDQMAIYTEHAKRIIELATQIKTLDQQIDPSNK